MQITCVNVVLDLSEGFVLLAEAVLIHLVEVDVAHDGVALVTDPVLFFVDL